MTKMQTIGDVINAMNSGEIRSFADQTYSAQVLMVPATELETNARIAYIGYILSDPNPIIIP